MGFARFHCFLGAYFCFILKENQPPISFNNFAETWELLHSKEESEPSMLIYKSLIYKTKCSAYTELHLSTQEFPAYRYAAASMLGPPLRDSTRRINRNWGNWELLQHEFNFYPTSRSNNVRISSCSKRSRKNGGVHPNLQRLNNAEH